MSNLLCNHIQSPWKIGLSLVLLLTFCKAAGCIEIRPKQYPSTSNDRKCPYGLVRNGDSGDCSSPLGDPCDVSKHSCGKNTECVGSRCCCRKGYHHGYNRIDCFPPEEIWRDKRFRFEPMRSWRMKDSPENRLIECQNNSSFSSKCADILNRGSRSIMDKLSSRLLLLGLIFLIRNWQWAVWVPHVAPIAPGTPITKRFHTEFRQAKIRKWNIKAENITHTTGTM
jgi:hypothetical protein